MDRETDFVAAIATSPRRVQEKSWEKNTITLPLGRSSSVLGTRVLVPANADDAEMGRKRQELPASLNAATAEAYRLVDGGK